MKLFFSKSILLGYKILRVKRRNLLIKLIHLPLIGLASLWLEVFLNFRAINVDCVLLRPFLPGSFKKLPWVLLLGHLGLRERS